jgi:hypothetical protein
MTKEPDYTLTITRENNGHVVYEGGESISNRFDNLAEAKWWLEQHRRWHQPCCCICGSAESLSDDPWHDFGVDRYGPDWTHTSCKEKFEYWARTEGPRGGGVVPKMEVLDAAWQKKTTGPAHGCQHDTTTTEQLSD